jgi:hypothetical protein
MGRTCTLTHGWEGDQLPCLLESVWVRQSFRRHPAGLGTGVKVWKDTGNC